MNQLKKPIKVRLLADAEEYFEELDIKVRGKFLKCFDKTELGMKGNWFEPLKATHGIWEFRQRDHMHYYRILAFWDKTSDVDTLILGTHGFNKKTNTTPIQEIQKAQMVKTTYFRNK